MLVVDDRAGRDGDGEGVHKAVDPADGEVYLWTSFEPDEARFVWACFDQPDLKAPHAFTVLAPAAWTRGQQQRRPRSSRTVERRHARWTLPRHAAAVDVQPRRHRRTLPRGPPRGRRPRPGPVLPGARSARSSTATPTSSSR